MPDNEKTRLYLEIVRRTTDDQLLVRMRLHGFWPASLPLPKDPAAEVRERDQIEQADNSEAVWMFLDFQSGTSSDGSAEPKSYDDVPLSVLLPAYMLSELKVAFLIGFQIYLPFLVIDMVISTLLISMGMMMLPPVLVSLPFKLLLFVLIDGWTLTVGMLLASVRPTG